MIDNLNLCEKILLKLGAGWQVYMQLSALWNLGAVVDNIIHLEYWDSVSTDGDHQRI